MITQTDIQPAIVARPHMISALAHLRKEWERAAGTTGLMDVSASVGLLLVDVSLAIGLTPNEQIQVLGQKLISRFAAEINTTTRNDGYQK